MTRLQNRGYSESGAKVADAVSPLDELEPNQMTWTPGKLQQIKEEHTMETDGAKKSTFGNLLDIVP